MLVASCVFNAVRAAPCLPLGFFNGDSGYYHRFLFFFFFVDILQFAGLSLLLLALLRKWKAGVAGVAGLSLAMSLAGSLFADESGWLVSTVHTGILAVDAPLGLVVGLVSPNPAFPDAPRVYSAFPLLNWFVFVAFGLPSGRDSAAAGTPTACSPSPHRPRCCSTRAPPSGGWSAAVP